MAVMSMDRLWHRRPYGSGGVNRNGAGYVWSVRRGGVTYRGPTLPTRSDALAALDVVVEALDRGEKPPAEPRPTQAGRVRAKTIPPAALLREVKKARENDWVAIEYPPDVDRPATRADCENTARPCPFVSCKHHLYLDVNPETGSIKFNRPDLEVWQLEESCTLDVADRGGTTLEEVGRMNNLTRERIRQYEVRALAKIAEADVDEELGEHLPRRDH